VKLKVRKDSREYEGIIVNSKDCLDVTLDKSDMDLLQRRGFVTDTGYAGAKVTIYIKNKE
jgi:hypothetical protein